MTESVLDPCQTMRQYLEFMRHVRDHGQRKDDRTGTGTLSVFGYQMRFDLAAGFPLLTTKRVHTKSVIHELLWFLAGVQLITIGVLGLYLGRMYEQTKDRPIYVTEDLVNFD